MKGGKPPAGAPPRARRSLGQHFIFDPALIERLAEAAGLERDDEVLEIGAGLGTLTAALSRRARRVVAVEIDPRLAARLRLAAPRAEVVMGDFLVQDLAAFFPVGGEVVVGNIPYYLSGAILRRLLELRPPPRRLSLVVQREVAERWTGKTGWSLSTLAIHLRADPHLAFLIPAEAFTPPPKVDSALVVIDFLPEPRLPLELERDVLSLAEAVFGHRRKQLRQALARAREMDPEKAETCLKEAGIDSSRRAQTLTVEEWARLVLRLGRPGDRR